MNISTSDWSSGCESGWTSYLDQFSNSSGQSYRTGGGILPQDYYESKGTNAVEVDENDEDMSMVSDASSGPPYFLEDKDCCNGSENFCYASLYSEQTKENKQKTKTKECKGKQQKRNSYLDDTATSSALFFSKRNAARSNNQTSMEHVQAFSQGFSATSFKRSVPGEATSEKAGGLQRRK